LYLDNALTATLTTNSWAHGTIANGTHTWRVDSVNGSNVITGPGWAFTLNNTSSIPSNPTPANGAIVNTKPLTLDWADTPGATAYDIYFGSNTSPTATISVSQYGPITTLDGIRLWR